MDESAYRRFNVNSNKFNEIFKFQAFNIDVFFCLKRGGLNDDIR